MMDIIRLFKGKVDITWHYILGMGKTNNQKSPYFYGILTSRLQKTVEEKPNHRRLRSATFSTCRIAGFPTGKAPERQTTVGIGSATGSKSNLSVAAAVREVFMVVNSRQLL